MIKRYKGFIVNALQKGLLINVSPRQLHNSLERGNEPIIGTAMSKGIDAIPAAPLFSHIKSPK